MSVSLYGSGQTVIQVVSFSTNTQYSTTSGTAVSTGITASITPQSTTSKILVLVNLAVTYNSTSADGVGGVLYRNGSQIFSPSLITGSGITASNLGSGVVVANQGFSYLDSPSSTSSQTYTVYFGAYIGGTAYINFGSGATTAPSSTITLLEVSGS
jgi:hypothetical protein